MDPGNRSKFIMAKRVAFYLRVSTGEQTTANQQRELETVAERHG